MFLFYREVGVAIVHVIYLAGSWSTYCTRHQIFPSTLTYLEQPLAVYHLNSATRKLLFAHFSDAE